MDLGSDPWEPPAAFHVPAAAPPAVDAGAAPDGEVSANEATTGDPTNDKPASPPPLDCPHADGQPHPVDVRMVKNHFQPAVISVCVGDPVTWTNEDTKEHTIYTGWPGKPDGFLQSPKIYYGKSWTWTFKKPGDFIYFCSTHKKKMQGAQVIVH